jgi:hypothetical protein
MSDEHLRNTIKEKMSASGIGYRGVAQITGVSASTICRYVNGGTILSKHYEALDCYVTGKDLPSRKTCSVQRFRVGGTTFLVTIERLEKLQGVNCHE